MRQLWRKSQDITRNMRFWIGASDVSSALFQNEIGPQGRSSLDELHGSSSTFLSTYFAATIFAAEVKIFEPTGTLPYLSVEESLKTFELPEGYRLEPVLTEPHVTEPVACAFDGNGRMYVVEMSTYMQDADATGEQEPKGRVSLHEDTNGNGKMDKHTVFAGNLLLHDGALINETKTLDIYWYVIPTAYPMRKQFGTKAALAVATWSTNPAASSSRWTTGFIPLTTPTAPNGGQWGLCQDDHGKPWFVNAGGERGPLNFQQPIVYGAFNVPDQFPVDYREVLPLVGIPDVQGGRIYRLVHDDFEPGPRPNMLDETPQQLVAHLEHPNGWWRDNAQKLILLRGDTSVSSALVKMARESESDLARMHAIWTLEGLGTLTPAFVQEKLKDENASVHRAAIRAGETLHKTGNENFENDFKAMAADDDPEVVIQSMLSAKFLNFADHKEFTAGVNAIGSQILKGGQATPQKLTPEQLTLYKEGKTIYEALCFVCHGGDGKGMPLPGGEDLLLAPSLVGPDILTGHREPAPKVVLHGLTGPVEGKTYLGEMISMSSNGDEWVASVVSYIKNSFGNDLGFINEEEVKQIREANADRTTPWTEVDLHASVPNAIPDRSGWKVTASHKSGDGFYAVDGNLDSRYTNGESMKEGMWLQVELPQPKRIVGVVLDAARSNGDYPRGSKIEFSLDGKKWSKPLKQKDGKAAKLTVEFPEQEAKYVKITQTGNHSLYWSIHDLNLLQRP